MEPEDIKPGDIVRVSAFDDVPEHDFEVLTVEVDHITGIARSGPFAGEYGEPDLELVLTRQP